MPFGPWILCKKRDWEDAEHEHAKWKRDQKRDKHGESDSSEESDSQMPQTQKDRGRKRNEE